MIGDKMASLKSAVSDTNALVQAYIWKLKFFKPKVLISMDTSRFLIKTAENGFELQRALTLRYEVFYRELLNKKSFLHIDIDRFDFIADHLIIVDKRSDEVVGTYRLISSNFSNTFYSESEFQIDRIKADKRGKLELGRACVHRDYRNGAVITLLWRGIVEYMKGVGAKYLFGCSSVNTTNLIEIGLIYEYMKGLYLSADEFRAHPRGKYRVDPMDRYAAAFEKFDIKMEAIEDLIPPLVKMYLKAGARVCGEPALDRKFKCADFLTILDMELLDKSFERKYRAKNA
ncbi:MAG: GNAT family N-acetyltransferase [Deltaproteobacteria bacterium]